MAFELRGGNVETSGGDLKSVGRLGIALDGLISRGKGLTCPPVHEMVLSAHWTRLSALTVTLETGAPARMLGPCRA